MKNQFNRAAAPDRETQTAILAVSLTPEQRAEYQALLLGQQVTDATAERRMAEQRPQMVERAFQAALLKQDDPKLELKKDTTRPKTYEEKVSEARALAETKVQQSETRLRAARAEIAAETRFRFVKNAELERNGIDPKGR